jgi:hypothetical protein
MEDNPGKQMVLAMKAVANMHSDCIKLFEDLDKAFPSLKSFYNNVVTLELGSSMSVRCYLAAGLIRLYHEPRNEAEFLSVNICFFDPNDPRFTEPLFVVARISYEPGPIDQKEKLKRGWDPWYAFLSWAPDRKLGEAMPIDRPKQREAIEQVTVAAAPLLNIHTLADALNLVNLVGGPPGTLELKRVTTQD